MAEMTVEDTGVKKRRISQADWRTVETYVKQETKRRETDTFRKARESIWKEVDRQIAMKPMRAINHQKEKDDWHNVIELGEFAKASEIITADVRRLLFPMNRAWYESHVELPPQLDPQTGQNTPPEQKTQEFIDGSLRAFMSQQHFDFGFKSRVELSVKEALHHGSFVAEVRSETAMLVYDGTGITSRCAPIWHPHSMWNCYPDPSPSVIGANMFYTGSMIIKEFMPLYRLKEVAKNEAGWMTAQLEKVPKRKNKNKDVDTEDVELVKYYGDISIKRQDGDIYLPNSKVILANDILIFYAPNDLPFPPVIYNGYERMDVRDPYFTSPLIKLAPLHKMASEMANKLLDAIALRTEPPVVFDGNDPDFVRSGGPVIAPGWKGPTKGLANFKTLEVGDPSFALQGLQLVLDQLRQGTSVDAIRAGASAGVDQTATETRLKQARGEVRVVDFVDKLEGSLRTFLYMQHEINKKSLDEVYTFYNPEMDAPDFMRMTKADLPENVHFEIVGARGVLGEEERAQKMTMVTAWAAGNPMFAPLLKPADLLKEAYQDAGVKNPERFINVGQESPEIQMVKQQAQQAMQELQQHTQELEQENAQLKSAHDIKAAEAERKMSLEEYKAQRASDLAEETARRSIELAQWEARQQLQLDQFMAGVKAHLEEVKTSHKVTLDHVKEANKPDSKINVFDSTMKDPMNGIGNAIQSMADAVSENTQVTRALASNMNRKKRVIFDENNRPVGIEPELPQ